MCQTGSEMVAPRSVITLRAADLSDVIKRKNLSNWILTETQRLNVNRWKTQVLWTAARGQSTQAGWGPGGVFVWVPSSFILRTLSAPEELDVSLGAPLGVWPIFAVPYQCRSLCLLTSTHVHTRTHILSPAPGPGVPRITFLSHITGQNFLCHISPHEGPAALPSMARGERQPVPRASFTFKRQTGDGRASSFLFSLPFVLWTLSACI